MSDRKYLKYGRTCRYRYAVLFDLPPAATFTPGGAGTLSRLNGSDPPLAAKLLPNPLFDSLASLFSIFYSLLDLSSVILRQTKSIFTPTYSGSNTVNSSVLFICAQPHHGLEQCPEDFHLVDANGSPSSALCGVTKVPKVGK